MDVNSAWKSTCNSIFGEELGELEEFAPYLAERQHYPCLQRKSSVSGKQVTIGSNRYRQDARFISEDEIDYSKKFAPLGINELKDLDSLIGALSERTAYCGNKILGNSGQIARSDGCVDSFFVQDSHTVISSKYVAYSSFVRSDSSFIFGSSIFINCSNLIRINGAVRLNRCFECSLNADGSDLFFCYDCWGTSHAMFSFNLQGKRHAIGNLELPKDKYLVLRKKLIAESAEYLRENKRFYSVFDFALPKKEEIAGVAIKAKTERSDMRNVEEAFSAATKLIFGKPLGPIRKYGKFLTERSEPVRKIRTAFGSEAFYSEYPWCKFAPKERMATGEEAFASAKRHIEIDDAGNETVDSIISKLGPIAFYNVDYDTGGNRNNVETPMKYHASDCLCISDATYSKKCGYCTHVQGCEAVFGSSVLMIDSSFSIRCHECVKVSNCLEMDCCKNCHRSMFCHNCEGLSDCMFCFNTKNKAYAIGNVEVGREKYLEARKMVVDELLKRLETQGTFGFDICNLAQK